MSGVGRSIRAVLDANLIVSGVITPHGTPSQVLRARQRGAFTLISSADLTDEVAGTLARPRIRRRYSPDAAEIARLMAALTVAEVQPMAVDTLPVHCRDVDDDAVLACALGGQADYIVTGDADLLVLDRHPALGTLRIVTPRAFLGVLSSEEPS